MGLFGGGDEKKPLKSTKKACNPDVDSCTSGEKSVHTRSRMSLSKFNPTRKRYNLPTGKKKKVEEPAQEGGGHMNMRDLSGTPGYASYNKEQGYNLEKDAEVRTGSGKKRELQLRKNRLKITK